MRGAFSRVRLAGLILGLTVLPCAVAPAQDYEVRLHRPEQPGEKSHISAVAREWRKQTVKSGDTVLQTSRFEESVECEAVATVLECDAKGKPAKLSLTIENCARTRGDARTEVAPKGAVALIFMKGQEQAAEINGQPASADAQEALSRVVQLSPGLPTDDEVFGAADRKKVGDRWAGNADLLAQTLQRSGVSVRKEDISSAVTLERVVKAGDLECLQLNGELSVAKLEAPVPPGATIQMATIQGRFAGKFPVDPSERVIPENSMEMTSTLVMKAKPNPEGPEVTVEMTMGRNLTSRESAVK